MKRITLITLTALTMLASCSGGDDGGESGNSSSSLVTGISSSSFFISSSSQNSDSISSSSSENQSSSSLEAEVLCLQNSEACVPMPLSMCIQLVIAGAAQIVETCDAPLSSSSYGQSSSSVQCSDYGNGTFIDAHNGTEYKYVTICTQTWMAENLNRNVDGSRCYGNDPENCKKYGRLYDSETAQTVCPEDWHLPNIEEWRMLFNFVDSSIWAAGKLKATSGWPDFNGQSGNGEDAYGFAALPGGYSAGVSYIYFYEIGNYGSWWSSTRYDIGEYYFFSMRYSSNAVGSSFGDDFRSIRCIKD